MAGLTKEQEKEICNAAVMKALSFLTPKASPKGSPKGSKTPKASPSGASPDKKRKRDVSCGICHEVGHNRATCSLNDDEEDNKKAKKAKKVKKAKKAKKPAKKVVIDVSSDDEATDDESSDSDSESESDSASDSASSDSDSDDDSASSDDEDDEPKKKKDKKAKKAKAGTNRCGACQKIGHNRQTCPMVKFWEAIEAEESKKGKCKNGRC